MSDAHAIEAPLAAPGHNRPPGPTYRRVCPECGTPHQAARPDAEFCGDPCRKTFNNRRLVRGAELYDLFMTLRCDRKRATAMGVWKLLCRMAQGYRDEDLARREGRKSWRDPARIVERRPYLNAIVVARTTWKRPDVG